MGSADKNENKNQVDEDPQDKNAIGPVMIPIGDLLNHIAKNNANICFSKHEMLICAIKPIKKNEEVYNTYGEHSNTDLLHMYGFVEHYPENTYDAVEVPVEILEQAIK